MTDSFLILLKKKIEIVFQVCSVYFIYFKFLKQDFFQLTGKGGWSNNKEERHKSYKGKNNVSK